MPQYVVKMVHSPDMCPFSNSKVRERVGKSGTELPKLAAQMGIRFVAGPLVMAVEHEAIVVVEAPSAETVSDFVMHSGLMQWNTVRISVTRPMDEVMRELEKAPAAIS